MMKKLTERVLEEFEGQALSKISVISEYHPED